MLPRGMQWMKRQRGSGWRECFSSANNPGSSGPAVTIVVRLCLERRALCRWKSETIIALAIASSTLSPGPGFPPLRGRPKTERSLRQKGKREPINHRQEALYRRRIGWWLDAGTQQQRTTPMDGGDGGQGGLRFHFDLLARLKGRGGEALDRFSAPKQRPLR